MKDMKKLDRRGVSPVIATILLILIAIAAGVIIYTYTIGFLGTAGTPGGAGEMVIDAATYTMNGTATVFVRNTGGTSWTVDRIFLTHVNTGAILLDPAPTTCTSAVGPGASATCGVADMGDFAPSAAGEDVTVKVVAGDGTTASITIRAV